MIKPILTTLIITTTPAFAATSSYEDTVTFSASAVCAELTGTQNPTKSSDKDWKSYLQCVEVMHYFNTKYN